LEKDEDLEMWCRFIDKDGLLVIHDYCNPVGQGWVELGREQGRGTGGAVNPFQPGVARACRSLLAPGSPWRITKKLADGIACSRG
jgi:hypothetical protein